MSKYFEVFDLNGLKNVILNGTLVTTSTSTIDMRLNLNYVYRLGSLKTYLNGFKILQYLHEMCFTYYDFSFKKIFNVVYNCISCRKTSFVTYFQELDAVFVNSHVT